MCVYVTWVKSPIELKWSNLLKHAPRINWSETPIQCEMIETTKTRLTWMCFSVICKFCHRLCHIFQRKFSCCFYLLYNMAKRKKSGRNIKFESIVSMCRLGKFSKPVFFSVIAVDVRRTLCSFFFLNKTYCMWILFYLENKWLEQEKKRHVSAELIVSGYACMR